VSNTLEMHVAWYTPEAWKRLAAIPEARIEKSYQDFVRTFEAIMRGYATCGVRPRKVALDVADIDEMVEWCHRNGYEIDSKGRATYGAMRAAGGLDAPLVDKTRTIQ
jgi:hypothetical protein